MTEFVARYWLETLFVFITTGLTASVNYLRKQDKNRKTEQDAIKLGIQALLRDRIIEQYNKWMEKGYIPIYALENVTAMYKEYHALGGNGTITQLYEELLELPHRKEDVGSPD
jgi:hypothetical protein